MWYVIGLIWLAVIAGVIWFYRKKQEQREAEHARKFSAFLAEAKLNPKSTGGTTPGSAADAAPAAVGAAPRPEFCKKQRLLPQADALLYYVLRTGLPGHEIFANLTLADVLDVEPAASGYEREQKVRKLAQQRLDFVICTKHLEVVAAVLLDKSAVPDAMHAGNARFAEVCLHSAGIRLVRINPAAPPRHHQVRELVYGAADSAGAQISA